MQTYAPQLELPASTQVPVPSQVSAENSVPELQLCATQTVPETCCRHAVAPLQDPSSPHVDAADAVHSLSGSVPAACEVHVPRLPAMLQAWHVDEHALLQHRPSTQNPDAHSPAALHVCPFDNLHAELAHS